MSVRPLRDRVLLERVVEESEQKVGGIIIPDTAKEKPQQGKVIAVGSGRVNDKGDVLPLDVKAGDTVLFGKYSGSEIKVDGKEYLIVREDEILGVVEGVRELAAGECGGGGFYPPPTAGRVRRPAGRAPSTSGTRYWHVEPAPDARNRARRPGPPPHPT